MPGSLFFFCLFRIRTESDSHAGRVHTKLTQTPSVYYKLKRGAAAGPYLRGTQAFHKHKKVRTGGSRVTNKTNRQESDVKTSGIQGIRRFLKSQAIQIRGGAFPDQLNRKRFYTPKPQSS